MKVKSNLLYCQMYLMFLSIVCPVVTGKIIYVDDDATGANNGSSWENAYTYLRDALTIAKSEEVNEPIEIHVAQGIYKPNQGLNQISPGGIGRGGEPYPPRYPADEGKQARFQLINNVTIKGGYAGIGEPNPNNRDVETYETILSGDLNGDDVEVNEPCDLLSEPSRADNCNIVVIGSNTDLSAVLDGFIITAGYLLVPPHSGSSNPHGGAGMYISSGCPTLVNCIFTSNATLGYGGGINIVGSNPTIVNCTFTRNNAGGGGGISIWQSSEGSCPTLIDCMFDDNYASGDGGGMYNFESNPVLNNCIFRQNLAENSRTYDSAKGGGMYNRMSNALLNNCTFIENIAGGGGGIYSEDNSSLILTNCIFRDNSAENVSGGGMYTKDANDLILTYCMFISNLSKRDGGGMFNSRINPNLINCVYSGNTAMEDGGGIMNSAEANVMITNCTFYHNRAEQGNSIFNSRSSVIKLVNSILWKNGNGMFNQLGAKVNITYSNIPGNWEGEGNIDADPLFANPGYWADVNDPNIIAEANDPNAVWVDGDYHLKSQAGRYDPNSGDWVIDDVTSPCIDTGDPNTPVGEEPEPNGGIVNMGAYGGTIQASKSLSTTGIITR